jgi:hypothetical protein
MAPLAPACLAGARRLAAPTLRMVAIRRVGIAVGCVIRGLIVIPATVRALIVVTRTGVIVAGVSVILAMVAPVAEPVLMGFVVVAVCLQFVLTMFPVGAAAAGADSTTITAVNRSFFIYIFRQNSGALASVSSPLTAQSNSRAKLS